MIKKNKTQLIFLYGKETVEALENAMLNACRKGNLPTISLDSLEDDNKLEKELKKIRKNK